MDSSLNQLLAFFEARRAARQPLILATVVRTEGSTYRKPGARMLFAAEGAACGLLSGGCLEGDLREHANRVLASGTAKLIEYDLRTSDDVIWGLGLGCEGAMQILLQRLGPQESYEPFATLAGAARAHRSVALATVVSSSNTAWPPGRWVLADSTPSDPIGRELVDHCARVLAGAPPPGLQTLHVDGTEVAAFLDRSDPPARILLLGAGPDAAPVVRAANALGWLVTLVDHRPAYAAAEHFPEAEHVLQSSPAELAQRVPLGDFHAAVVMSHHLPSDLEYLRQLATHPVPYVGLLGPAARRQRLLAELGATAASLDGRLYGPVGLDIGARTPDAIALAIVAEIHAVLAGRSGRPFSVVTRTESPR